MISAIFALMTYSNQSVHIWRNFTPIEKPPVQMHKIRVEINPVRSRYRVMYTFTYYLYTILWPPKPRLLSKLSNNSTEIHVTKITAEVEQNKVHFLVPDLSFCSPPPELEF